MNLTQKDIGLLRKMITDNSYELLKVLRDTLFEKWDSINIDEETAFLTAKKAIERQERKNGIDSFLKVIEEIAHGR